MADTEQWMESFADDEESLHLRRPRRDSAELDMTPMIDCVFLLLIFFLVASQTDAANAVELPPARYGVGADPQKAVMITLAKDSGNNPALVYLADGKIGEPLPREPHAQQAAITSAVDEGRRGGKNCVIIKGEKTVKYRDAARVVAAAGQVEGMRLFLAIFEVE
ncbi:MAG: biopolymer transporter ExbD [Pirellulales bacterium]|nr:biopolymer transporter ExbD [Pirellulales bacterium]